MNRRLIAFALGLVLLSIAIPATQDRASGSIVPRPFHLTQTEVLRQLAIRANQLSRLGFDVAHSATLSPTHAKLLDARLANASSDLSALSAKVRADISLSALRADRISMLNENRVFAVLTPQVFLTVNSDAVFAEIANFHSGEPALEASVMSLLGQSGYQNARAHYRRLVREVDRSTTLTTRALNEALEQRPSGFPRNTRVFVDANRRLLAAGRSLAQADYDESVIGLATGGYRGP